MRKHPEGADTLPRARGVEAADADRVSVGVPGLLAAKWPFCERSLSAAQERPSCSPRAPSASIIEVPLPSLEDLPRRLRAEHEGEGDPALSSTVSGLDEGDRSGQAAQLHVASSATAAACGQPPLQA